VRKYYLFHTTLFLILIMTFFEGKIYSDGLSGKKSNNKSETTTKSETDGVAYDSTLYKTILKYNDENVRPKLNSFEDQLKRLERLQIIYIIVLVIILSSIIYQLYRMKLNIHNIENTTKAIPEYLKNIMGEVKAILSITSKIKTEHDSVKSYYDTQFSNIEKVLSHFKWVDSVYY